MKITLLSIFLSVTVTPSSSFTIIAHSGLSSRNGCTSSFSSPIILSSEPAKKDDGESGLDLDLEEMFTMFDSAAKEENFDDALKKVKKESK
jgi:hypothetical protein